MHVPLTLLGTEHSAQQTVIREDFNPYIFSSANEIPLLEKLEQIRLIKSDMPALILLHLSQRAGVAR